MCLDSSPTGTSLLLIHNLGNKGNNMSLLDEVMENRTLNPVLTGCSIMIVFCR